VSNDFRSLQASLGEHHWWFVGMRRIMLEMAGLIQGRVLDVGCGVGWDLVNLPDGARGVGVDRAAERVQYRPLVLAQAGALPFVDRSFDWVLAIDLLDQRDVDPAAALGEIRRVLRPRGRMVLRVPAYPALMGPHDEAWGGGRRFRREEIADLVGEAGLTTLRLTYANSLLFPLAGASRLLARAGLGSGQDVRPLPESMNRLATALLDVEGRWLHRADLPFGLSLLCIAARPEAIS